MDIQEPSLTKTNLSPTIFSTLFHNMFDAVVIYNYEAEKIIDCNNSLLKLLGYSKEELLVLNRFDLMPRNSPLYPNVDIHSFIRMDHRQKVLDGESIFSRGELTKKNGESVFAELNIIPISIGTGDAFVIVHDITQSYRHRKEIQESQEEYRTIFNNACEAIIYFDLKTEKLERCNDIVIEMFGVKDKEAFLNADFEKFYDNKDKIVNSLSFRKFFSKAILEAKRDGNSCNQFMAKRNNGETFIAELTTVFVNKQENSKIVFFVKDISQKFFADKEREEFYHEEMQILNSMPVQFSQKDLKNNILKCNEAMKNVLDKDAKNIVGKNLSELISKEDAENAYQDDLKIIKTKEPILGYTFSIKTKEGKSVWGQIDKLPLFDQNQNVKGILTYVTDITKLIDSQQQTKESERNYRALFDNAFDGIMVYDCNVEKVLRCNLKLAEYLSTHPDVVVKNSLEHFSPEYQTNGMKSSQYFSHIVNKTKKRGTYTTEWTFEEKDGEKLTSELISFLLPQENACQVIFIFKDISERKEQEVIIKSNVEELNKKNAELKKYIESNQQLDKFAAIASHDLQAPLRTIHSYTQVLQKSIKDNATEAQKECMHFITTATSNMRHLIRDLRMFSKVDATKLHIRSINTKHMIEEVLSELKASIEYKKAEVILPETIPNIMGDRIKLKQLFQNFFTNALKYIGDEVIPKIQIATEEEENHWKFKVKDNGIGISKNNQKRIFQLFQRLHAPEEYSGTGIGLSLCKKVVDQHFGEIGVDSEVGQGSTFHFTVPKNIQERFKNIP